MMAPTIEPKSVSYHEGFEIGEVENPSKDNNSVDDYWEEPGGKMTFMHWLSLRVRC